MKLLFSALVLSGMLLSTQTQDEKSPDQQQQRHEQNVPPTQATAPGADHQTPAGTNATDPNGSASNKKDARKAKHVKHPHGTPDPGK